jgi:hypothetical protein
VQLYQIKTTKTATCFDPCWIIIRKYVHQMVLYKKMCICLLIITDWSLSMHRLSNIKIFPVQLLYKKTGIKYLNLSVSSIKELNVQETYQHKKISDYSFRGNEQSCLSTLICLLFYSPWPVFTAVNHLKYNLIYHLSVFIHPITINK